MTKPTYFLAIDNGTQSVRAMIFDQQGTLIAKSKVDIEPYFSNQTGWAEQEPDYFWSSLCQACEQLWPLLDFPKERLDLVQQLNERYRVFLFSNTNAIHFREVQKELQKVHGIPNLESHFEKVYLSHELGIRKPKLEGFQYILNMHQLNPNETLFVDDSPQHIQGALKAGIKAEWLNLDKEDIHVLLNRLKLI